MRLGPDVQLGTQRYFIEQVVTGLENGIHYFAGLKGRQQGITTICGALDLFWHQEFAGMQGTFAAHNEEARDNFRSMLTMYQEGLPRTHRIPLVTNNRYFLAWRNRSRLAMQIGGGAKSKRTGGKGRGQAFAFMHATECSSWEDDEQLASILASLAQRNPLRLFVFESTARGFNLWHDMWKDAKNAVTQKAIFIGWWRNQFYRCEKGTNEYRVYWGADGKLTPAEREWVRAVKLLYAFDIAPEQMAWWRWMAAEVINDENLLLQEHPPTEQHAFILSGKNFFSAPALEELRKELERSERPHYFKLRFGMSFMETSCEETIEQHADLTVWEHPDDRGYYSIGADPAFGSSDWADRFVISVWRCYADRFDQVAEFCVTDLSTYKFAWVLCYLAGAYKQSSINLEINGPGEAVLSEMDNLRRQAAMIPRREGGKAMTDVLGHIQYYLYRRLDSPGGAGFAYHWKTTASTKERMMNIYRDLWYKKVAQIHSVELLEEMKIIVREDEGGIAASGKGKDDRVIGAALAAEQYERKLKLLLMQMKVTWQAEAARRHQRAETGKDVSPQGDALSRSITNYLQSVGAEQ